MGLVILVSFSRKMSKQKLSQKRGLSRSFIIILQKPKLLFSLSLSDTSHTTQTQRQTITFEKVKEKCYLRSKYNTFLCSEKCQIIHVEINYIIKRQQLIEDKSKCFLPCTVIIVFHVHSQWNDATSVCRKFFCISVHVAEFEPRV